MAIFKMNYARFSFDFMYHISELSKDVAFVSEFPGDSPKFDESHQKSDLHTYMSGETDTTESLVKLSVWKNLKNSDRK